MQILLIFSKEGCMRFKVPFKEDIWKISLWGELVLSLRKVDGNWYLQENILGSNTPVYCKVGELELCLFLSEEIEDLKVLGRLQLKQGQSYKVGSSYQNHIFYQCFSFVEGVHMEILSEESGAVLLKHGKEGIYRNGSVAETRQELTKGDVIDLYGMHIILLKEMLVVCLFQGVGRVAERGSLEGLRMRNSGEQMLLPIPMETYTPADTELHTGEVEVLQPLPRERTTENPLLLGLGPSMTMVLPVLLMALMGSQNKTGGNFYYLSVVMSLCSCFLALFWGLVNHFYRRHQWKEKEKHRVGQYREYLERMRGRLELQRSENRNILEQRYPPVPFFLGKAMKVMQNRYYLREDFLLFRIGTGNIPFQLVLKKSGENRIVSERLAEEAEGLIKEYRWLPNAPIGVDFNENRLVGITGSEEVVFGMLRQLLFQIAACHAPNEVKVACFYQKERREQKLLAENIRWMPHNWSLGGRCRFIAGDENEAAEMLPLLTKEIEKGSEQKEREHSLPRYLILILDKELLVGEPIYQHLCSPEGKYPVSTLFYGRSREEIPVGCSSLLLAKDTEAEMIHYGQEVTYQRLVTEFCDESTLDAYLRELAVHHNQAKEKDEQMPESIGFLEMYGCTNVRELDSKYRWERSRPQERLKIPIGVRGGGSLVYLDIHEKFHGPHGLIAGTTGSGKSELIQTWLLSMAVSFSPLDINFFMIDYKGGGTGNALMSLPHCSGIISNLSGKQIKRAMSAISSENKRRQQLLNQYQVNHVDKYGQLYRQGKATEPMPHLLLVVDEFAELKKEEPEFMQEIISLAQVGRSLGMHLVLATQKPAGTVDDKIWSNARFRLCLRVQDKQDSMDMLHKQDAALLTLPGQCYLQIGNHEYFELFQTAYCGGIYHQDGEKAPGAVLVTNTGKRIRNKQRFLRGKNISQLEAVIDYVNQVAKENSYERAHSLWLPELPEAISPEEIFMGNVIHSERSQEVEAGNQFCKQPSKEETEYLLGLCDDPGRQRQYPIFYSPKQSGHLAVVGGPATGKTTLLQTLMWQMVQRSAGEVNLLIADMSGSVLRSFSSFPHCLGLLKEEEEKKVFFYHLEGLFTERKKQLSGLNFYQYKQAGKGQMAEVFLVIDGYGAFAKGLNERQEELMLKIATEGVSYGIYLMIAASGVSEMPGRMFEKIKKTIALEMSDKFTYGDILRKYHITVFPADNVKGRGLCKEADEVLEFQTALIFKELHDFERMEQIEKEGKMCSQMFGQEGGNGIRRFPVIPSKPDSTELYQECKVYGKKDALPLGYDRESGAVEFLDISKSRCFLISGEARSGKKNFLAHLTHMLLLQEKKVILYDSTGELEGFKKRKGLIYVSNWRELLGRTEFQNKTESQSWQKNKEGELTGKEKYYLVINHLWEFISSLYGKETTAAERQFWEQEVQGGLYFSFMTGICLAKEHYEEMSTIFFREFVKKQWGIHLGGNALAQRVLRLDDLGYLQQTQKEKPGIGYLKAGEGSETKFLKLPFYR